MMYDHGKSHSPIGPKKRPNKPEPRGAEAVEERRLAEGNSGQHDTSRTQSRKTDVPLALERIREAARRERDARFTALLHHVDVDRLRQAYVQLNPLASPGVDGETWKQYGQDLEARLQDLHGRLHRGAYRAKPSRRVYIPKPDGGKRPLGIAAVEDKIVQKAVTEVLSVIYEVDFYGFSYGFRPGKSAHQALDALAYGIIRRKVNWVLDADIRGYFDAINHDKLLKILEHRIGDPRILRLIRKWLNAGVLEAEQWAETKRGTPQGATISPLLANVYLHEAFDHWAHQWRQRGARGEVTIVRYADDFVVGFQYRHDAERFLVALGERFAAYDLELHPDKTRILEFGRFARRDRDRRGGGKPPSFDFLGFTHLCGVNRKGGFLLRRHTVRKRMRVALQELKQQLQRRRHRPKPETGKWLGNVLTGYYNYYAVPTNLAILRAIKREVSRMWLRQLRRRSHKDRTTWETLQTVLERWLPEPTYRHPWPNERLQARLT